MSMYLTSSKLRVVQVGVWAAKARKQESPSQQHRMPSPYRKCGAVLSQPNMVKTELRVAVQATIRAAHDVKPLGPVFPDRCLKSSGWLCTNYTFQVSSSSLSKVPACVGRRRACKEPRLFGPIGCCILDLCAATSGPQFSSKSIFR